MLLIYDIPIMSRSRWLGLNFLLNFESCYTALGRLTKCLIIIIIIINLLFLTVLSLVVNVIVV